MSDSDATPKEGDPLTPEAAALEFLISNHWSAQVISGVEASALGRRRLFPSDRRGLKPPRPANEVAFQVVDLVLHAAQGALGVARRTVAEVLGVAVTTRPLEPETAEEDVRPPTARRVAVAGVTERDERPAAARRLALAGAGEASAALAGAEVASAALAGADDASAAVSRHPVRMGVRAGERAATCSFVVENATGRTLHTVAFKVPFLAGPNGTIPAHDVRIEPAMFALPPHRSQRVTLSVRTTDVPPGRYVGLAEAGRFRQVIALEVT